MRKILEICIIIFLVKGDLYCLYHKNVVFEMCRITQINLSHYLINKFNKYVSYLNIFVVAEIVILTLLLYILYIPIYIYIKAFYLK